MLANGDFVLGIEDQVIRLAHRWVIRGCSTLVKRFTKSGAMCRNEGDAASPRVLNAS
jgi:hypothetical protein